MLDNNDHLAMLQRLRNMLSTGFNLDELKSLCFELGIDYENLGGQGKSGKTRELVGYMDRRGRIEDLARAAARMRPELAGDEGSPGSTSAEPESAAASVEYQPPARRTRILFLAANPSNMQPLSLDVEIREIDRALRQSEFRDRFVIEQQWAVSVQDLQEHFLRYQPDIVHFSGHGSPSNAIILKSSEGFSQPVSPEALSRLFQTLKDNIRCVVLNACYSENQARAIAEHIDCVVGMRDEIGDAAAARFAAAFYRALGYGRNVKTAVELGSGQLQLDGLDDDQIPELIALRKDPEQIDFV